MRSHNVICSADFPVFIPGEAGHRFSDPGGCQAELTSVMVTSQDSLPAKNGHLSQK